MSRLYRPVSVLLAALLLAISIGTTAINAVGVVDAHGVTTVQIDRADNVVSLASGADLDPSDQVDDDGHDGRAENLLAIGRSKKPGVSRRELRTGLDEIALPDRPPRG